MASDVSQQQPILAVLPDTCSSSANHRPLPTLPLLIYWDSFEAREIFQPVHSERNALDAIDNQIMLLVEASESPKAYLGVVVSGTMEAEEIDEEMSDHQRWCINQKIIILTMALLHAKQKNTKLGFMLRASNTPSNRTRTTNCKVFSDRSKSVPRVLQGEENTG
jgi:hypothetical protein